MAHANIYLDRETKDRLTDLADRTDRSIVNTVRRVLEYSLDNLSPLDVAVIKQVAADQGLADDLAAVSFIIRDWTRLQRRRSPMMSIHELIEQFSEAHREGHISDGEAAGVLEALGRMREAMSPPPVETVQAVAAGIRERMGDPV